MEFKHQKTKSKMTKRESSLMRKLFKLSTTPTLKQSLSTRNLYSHNTIEEIVKRLPYLSPTKTNNKVIKKYELSRKVRPFKEAKLDFYLFKKQQIDNPLLKLCFRYINSEKHGALSEQTISIIRIQSYYRGFISRKNFISSIRDSIEEKGIKDIILIQSKIKQYLFLKQFKEKLFNERINRKIDIAVRKITNKIRQFYYKNNGIKAILLNDINKERRKCVLTIQKVFRGKIYRDIYKNLKENIKNNYFFTYPFYAKKVDLKVITIGEQAKEECQMVIKSFPFEYNPILRTLVLLIPPEKVQRGKHRCQFIVDGNATCDGRYPHTEFGDGLFYNIVDFVTENQLKMYDIDNEYQETGPDDVNIQNYSNSVSDKVFLNGIKTIKENDDYSDLRIHLYGKTPVSQLDNIRRLSWSEIEGNY